MARACRAVEPRGKRREPHSLLDVALPLRATRGCGRARSCNIAHALHHLNDAVRLAEELNNAELLAASLFRRAKTHEAHRQLTAALADINAALPYAQRSRDQLRGYVFQMAGELISRLPPSQENAKRYRFLMEEPRRILRKGAIEDDKSFTKLSLTGYQQDRARGFLRFGDYDAALEALAVAEKAQTPEMTRWAAETAILRAQVFAATGEVEWACSELEEALPLVTATRSSGKKRKARQPVSRTGDTSSFQRKCASSWRAARRNLILRC